MGIINMLKLLKKKKNCISEEVTKQREDITKQLEEAHEAMEQLLKRANTKLAS